MLCRNSLSLPRAPLWSSPDIRVSVWLLLRPCRSLPKLCCSWMDTSPMTGRGVSLQAGLRGQLYLLLGRCMLATLSAQYKTSCWR